MQSATGRSRAVRRRTRLIAAAGAVCAALLLPVAASADSWTIMSSPDTSSSANNDLFGVWCVSAGDCYAVGYYTDSGTGNEQALIEHESGQTWSIMTGVPDPNTNNAQLDGITCVSDAECWAVGYYTPDASTNGIVQPLIERYNGTSWSIDPSADTGVDASAAVYLNDVACTSSTNCWAVGAAETNSSYNQNFIEQYDGTGWSVDTSSPDANNRTNQLQGVTCTGSTCFAVGFYETPSASSSTTIIAQNLVLENTGSGWTLMGGVPDTSGDQENYLFGVSCVSASNCWAAGNFTDATADQALAMHYDGTGWTIATTPDQTDSSSNEISNDLYSVSCDATTGDCWAVGGVLQSSGEQTLIEENTGGGWTLVSAPDATTDTNNNLYFVSCPDATDCVAVGSVGGSVDQTLIETNAPVLTAALPELPLGPLATVAVAGGVIWFARRRLARSQAPASQN